MSWYKQETPPQNSTDSINNYVVKSRNKADSPISHNILIDAAALESGSPSVRKPAAISRQTSTTYVAEKGLHYHADEDSSLGMTDEIMMATTVSDNGTMGCAFFSTRDGRLSIAQDVPFADASTMQHFLEHIRPSSIIVPENLPITIAEMLDSYVDRCYQGKSPQNTTILAIANIRAEKAAQVSHVATLENSEFSIQLSRDRLLGVSSNLDNETLAIFHLQPGYQSKDQNTRGIPSDGESSDIGFMRLTAKLGSKDSESVRAAHKLSNRKLIFRSRALA